MKEAVKKYEENPFKMEILTVLSEHVSKRKEWVNGNNKVANSIVNYETGEVIGETALFRYKEVDSDEFAKVYGDKVKYMYGMTKAALGVFQYILKYLEKDKDEILLFAPDIEKECGLTERSVFNGISWLLQNKFIAKKYVPNIYFINATIYFNGDRLALIDVYETKEAAQARKKAEGLALARKKQLDLFSEENGFTKTTKKIE